MKIDTRRLRSHIAKTRRQHGDLPDRRETTGATRVVRENLDLILRLHEHEGVSWSELAAALGDQGVTEGKGGKPISTSRLTSIVCRLRQQIARAEKKQSARRTRADAVAPTATPVAAPRPHALSQDLARRPFTGSAGLPSEDELLRRAFDQKRHLLKGAEKP